jgi:vacuolar protein sorting-associated protein 13A/C
MIEKLICKALNKVLGHFVEDITADSLKVAVTSGRASLENLRVRPDCIQELGLPVTLNAGVIGSIVVDVPIDEGSAAISPSPILFYVKNPDMDST